MTTPALYLEGFVGETITALAVRAHLEAAGGEDVTVRINSPGGVVTEGLAVYRALAEYAGKVTAIVDGLAASAASMIAMAASRIVMPDGALMMIHDPSGMTIGPASAHRQSADVLDKFGESVAAIYAKRSGQTPAKVLAMMAAETWMTGKEAVKLGFADEISVDAPAQAFAFDYRIFNHAPAQLVGSTAKDITMAAPVVTAPVVKDVAGEILARCALAKLTADEIVNVHQAAAGDLDKAQAAIINAVAARDTTPPSFPVVMGTQFDNPAAVGNAISEAIYARMSGKPATGPAAEWMGRSLLDMGAATLAARGEKIVSWNRDRLATQIMNSGGTHSTSDFPYLTLQAGQRYLGEAYRAAETPLKQLARVRNAPDFRALTVGRLSEAPALEEVPEGAEVTYGSRTESKESFRLKTFARIFSISRQALINDDLSAFSDTLQAFGRAAAETEATQIVSLLTANSGNGVTLDDEAAWFTTGRGNKAGSGGAITVDTLSAARKAFRDVKGLDSVTPLSLTPRYLVVGSDKETEAEVMLSAIAAATTDDVNPFSAKMTLLVEPRLTGNSWRLFADPAQAAVLEIAYLNGTTGPLLATQDGWTVLGTEYRAVLDFGCGVTGWRGSYLNPGN